MNTLFGRHRSSFGYVNHVISPSLYIPSLPYSLSLAFMICSLHLYSNLMFPRFIQPSESRDPVTWHSLRPYTTADTLDLFSRNGKKWTTENFFDDSVVNSGQISLMSSGKLVIRTPTSGTLDHCHSLLQVNPFDTRFRDCVEKISQYMK